MGNLYPDCDIGQVVHIGSEKLKKGASRLGKTISTPEEHTDMLYIKKSQGVIYFFGATLA